MCLKSEGTNAFRNVKILLGPEEYPDIKTNDLLLILPEMIRNNGQIFVVVQLVPVFLEFFRY